MENLVIREIEKDDYNKGYLDLMYEFTNFKYNLTENDFSDYIDNNKYNNKILVIMSKIENKIIGAGSIFKIEKLHNNPIGQIEDVIINSKYRGFGIGKIIIKKLIDIGINELKCYKVILNCLDKNIKFYEKCNFIVAGVEMKLNN